MKRHICIFTTILLLILQFLSITPNVNLGNINVKAVENDITGIGMEPIISAPMVNLTESITVTYEDINAIDFELEYEADGISTVLLEDEDYLELEISALENVEFGTM